MHERRSAAHASAQLDWVDQAQGQGVGARQGLPSLPQGGGGYLNECTPPQLFEEARLRELHDMGLAQIWLDVAAEMGYDAFMRMWIRLDAAITLRSENDSMIEIQLSRFRAFQRFQRNRFIETLVSMGLTRPEIRARVKRELGEDLSQSHISRLTARRRVRA